MALVKNNVRIFFILKVNGSVYTNFADSMQ